VKGTPRIAVGSIFVECNEFGGRPTDMARFRQYELRYGPDVLHLVDGAVGGMLQVLAEQGGEPVPLLVASTCSGGPVTAECYAKLKGDLLQRLSAAGEVQGVLLALHGSAVVAGLGDLEGDLLRAVRAAVGPTIPIIGTLDLHAHVTAEMVASADALVAWETYPHKDAFTTGQRGARLLLDAVAGRCRPAMAMAKVPVLTGALRGSTEGDDPFADLMRETKALERAPEVLSTSLFMVHPNLDLPGMGSGALVVADGDMERAVALAEPIALHYWQRRHELDPEVLAPAEAIRRGLQIEGGPVLLVEAADCAGGGAAGDSVASVRALVEAGVSEPALAMVVDPRAAARCHHAGIAALVTLSLGHQLDPQWGQPIELTGRVARLSEGRFQYTGGIWAGTWASMGPTAVLEVDALRILIASEATYDWADEQYRAVSLDPRTAKFVVAKNPMNYRYGYAGISRGALVLDTPGPTPPTVRRLPYRHVQRPYFPADDDIPGLRPTILRGRFAAAAG
jgi:microcystin degradation protein MlrC